MNLYPNNSLMKAIQTQIDSYTAAKRQFYNNVIAIVFGYINIYACIYYLLGAKFTAIAQLSMAWTLTPLILILDRKNFHKSSRLLFILCCLLSLLFPSWGVNSDIRVDYYFLAALLVPPFLFETHEKISITSSQLACVLVWGTIRFLPHPSIPASLMPMQFPHESFQIFNMAGSLVIIAIITKFFVNRYENVLNTLQQNSNRQELILESSRLGAWDWSLESNKVIYDRRWCEMIGLKLEETNFSLETWDQRVHPDDKEKAYQDIQNYLEGKTENYQNIHRLRHANGSWIWILDTGKISERNSEGKAIRFTGIHYDITFYKEAEQVQKSIEQIAKIGGWTLILDTNELHWSEEVYRLHALPFNSPTDTTMSIHFYALHDRPRITEYIKKCCTGIPFRDAFDFIDANGTFKWVETMGEPVYDSNGKIYKIQGTFQDITNLKERELELKQIFMALDESAIVAMTDSLGLIISVNDNFCKVSGYSKDELIGADHRIVSSGTHQKTFIKDLWSTIQSGKNWYGEIKNKNKSGDFYFIQAVINPLLDANGNVQRYLSICFDVTNEKRTQQQLEEAQSVAKIGSWSYNIASGEIRWSKELFNLYPEDPLVGPPTFERLYSTIHPDDQKHWLEIIQNCIQNGTPYRMRCRSVFPDGKYIWQEAFGTAHYDKHGKIVSLSGTSQDISDLVKAEEATKLERSKAMHNAKLASLGEMSAGMAHEINNPLSIITATTWSLTKFVNDPEKIKLKLENIEKASERISKIVNGLRKFSRSSEKIEYKIHSLDLLIKEALTMTAAKCNRFSTSIDYNSSLEGNILCDEMEIEQILVNLINNGVDANKNNSDKWIKIELLDGPLHYHLRITDSGHGISPAVQARLFEPFFTTKAVGEGTGLGLSIVKGIIDEHNATIEVLNDSPNTCFEIKFKKGEV